MLKYKHIYNAYIFRETLPIKPHAHKHRQNIRRIKYKLKRLRTAKWIKAYNFVEIM